MQTWPDSTCIPELFAGKSLVNLAGTSGHSPSFSTTRGLSNLPMSIEASRKFEARFWMVQAVGGDTQPLATHMVVVGKHFTFLLVVV